MGGTLILWFRPKAGPSPPRPRRFRKLGVGKPIGCIFTDGLGSPSYGFFCRSGSAKICEICGFSFATQRCRACPSTRIIVRHCRVRRRHVPVMLKEVLQLLQPQAGADGIVDGTVGAGGTGCEILRRIGPSGTLIGLDRDARMLEIAAPSSLGPTVFPSALRPVMPIYDRSSGQPLPPGRRPHFTRPGVVVRPVGGRRPGFQLSSDGPLDLRFDGQVAENPAADLARAAGYESELGEIFDKVWRRTAQPPHRPKHQKSPALPQPDLVQPAIWLKLSPGPASNQDSAPPGAA